MKTELHPRNKHQAPYDFKALIASCPDLEQFVQKNRFKNESIDFSNPKAVKSLNQALLKYFYDLNWDIPEHFLCPPIPGRADYIHYLADILAIAHNGNIPRGSHIKVLDIGVGANCIYPLIGHKEYGWSFVGTDIDPKAVDIAEQNIHRNHLENFIKIYKQNSPSHIFEGLFKPDELFDISMCNPPFHTSSSEAKAGTLRKWKNLGIKTKALNFGGQSHELWCPGGEAAFIKEMIHESVHAPCKWFTTLVSKASNLPGIYKELDKINPTEVKTLEMGQGQKKSRIVAWTLI